MNNIIKDAPAAQEKNDLSSGEFWTYNISLAAENADRQNIYNTIYPRRVKIDSREKLSRAAEFDSLGGMAKKNTRGDENFEWANAGRWDIDNGHTEDPNHFVWPRDIIDAWPDIRGIILSVRDSLKIQGVEIPTDITLYLTPSRNNEREKDGKAARPKIHIDAPWSPRGNVKIRDGELYKQFQDNVTAEVNKRCGFELFDPKHNGAPRFFLANTTGKEGDKAIPLDMTRTRAAGKISFDNYERAETAPPVQSARRDVDIIPQGGRNSEMYKVAHDCLDTFADENEAREKFFEYAKDCKPELSKRELLTTFASAKKRHKDAPKREKKGFSFVTADTIKTAPPEWLWGGVLAKGELNAITGKPGVGKSFHAMQIAAAITRDDGVLPSVPFRRDPPREMSFENVGPGNIVYLSGDDSVSKTVTPRLLKMGADLSRVVVPSSHWLASFDEAAEYEKMFEEKKPALVVFDTFQHFFGGDMNAANKTTAALHNVLDLLRRYNTAGLVIMHPNKFSMTNGGDPMAASIGSIAIQGIIRSSFTLGHAPGYDGKENFELAFCHTKGNYTEGVLASVVTVIKDGRVSFLRIDHDLTDRELLTAGRPAHRPDDMMKAAMGIIRDRLRDGKEPNKDMKKEVMEATGCSKSTYHTALNKVKAEAVQ
jgi:hypothetical protein